jgi:hypothetical protein
VLPADNDLPRRPNMRKPTRREDIFAVTLTANENKQQTES